MNLTKRTSLLQLIAIALLVAGCDQPEKSVGKTTQSAEVPKVTVKAAEPLPDKISFNEHIQPILSEYCYHCHGPDSGTREPKDEPLRLDRVADAYAKREDGKFIIAKGKPMDSPLIKRITTDDPDDVMPPPESRKSLKPREIALIERWIEQGGEYEAHWSLTPVKKPEIPAAGNHWAANPIDHFIADKLDAVGLKPNPPEDPARFYRRLHFDITGLPPSPDAVSAFVEASAKDAQAATDQAADALLATTECAENFTRQWLDAARYADTHGIHIDNYRAIWPYRDWVIRAFTANMPWDEFTTEQLAGDMLPNHTLDQLVATGFSRCLATTGEGGAIPEEYDAIYAKDRVETVSAIWLGLTTGCAACHDHKFDPISTKEFYALTAFFRNTPMTALDGNRSDHPPSIFVPLLEDRPRLAALEKEIASVKTQQAERAKAAKPDFEKWLVTATIHPTRDIDSTLAIHLPLTDPDGAIHGSVDGHPTEWPTTDSRIDSPSGKALVVSDAPVDLGDIGSFARGDQVTYGGFIRIEGKPTGSVIARMNPNESFRGWDLYLEEGKPAAHVIDSWDKAANKIVANKPLPSGEWHHVMITFDGRRSGHQASAIYIDGKKAKAGIAPNSVGGNIVTSVHLRLGEREDGQSKLNGKVALQDFRFYRRLLTPSEIEDLAETAILQQIATIPNSQRTDAQKNALFAYFIANMDEPSRAFQTHTDALNTQSEALRAHGSMSLVMAEKPEPAFAHVLLRGVYSAKGDKVTPDTPAVLPPMAADAPKNRLGLARWLNDPANPLPARVTMNRAWSYLFGNGIVETNADFGIMGARPTHPKLLDWLATQFVESKWDYRHMIRLMVTSATYRQSGEVIPERLEKDPSNQLLSRGPRFRLDAEQLRDMALDASGLLVEKTGGPSVKPYQPEGIWAAVAMPQSNTRNYVQDTGDNLYRRSLYTIWKRTAAPPSMEILNAPTRETFCVQRDRTNTPLQALVLLNDPQFVEASRELASHAMKAATDFNTRLDFITRRLDARTFSEDERKVVRKTLEFAQSNFDKSPDDALKLIATGDSKPRADAPPAELAAWTLIASQILNLDETLTH